MPNLSLKWYETNPRAALLGAGFVAILALTLAAGAVPITGQETGDALGQAKRAQTPACPAFSLERFADVFFISPTWESGANGDGTTLIHVYGPLARHNNKLVVARISYAIGGDGSLSFNAMDITGISQSEQTYAILTKKVCPAAG